MDDLADRFVNTGPTPYSVAIFTRALADNDLHEAFAAAVFRLAVQQPGFIGAERSTTDTGRFGISLFFFRDEAALDGWLAAVDAFKAETGHQWGEKDVFDRYIMRIAKVYDQFELGGSVDEA